MCLAVATATWAESINEQQALAIATRFMASHAMPSSTLKMSSKAPRLHNAWPGDKASAAYYYVFNATRGGYVIVAGDDRVPAVLGYSDKGNLAPQDAPDAFKYLLEGYAAQIEALDHGAMAMTQVQPRPAIAPLLASAWSQQSPYNAQLPVINGHHAVVGCAATAMAQILYYWKWPARPTTTIPAYTSSTLSIYMPALTPVNFDWESMQDTYLTSDSTSINAQAAATLSKYCAQAIEMDFLDGASGANTPRAPWVLSTYFGYKASAHSEYRTNFTTQEWCDLIYSELAAGRPVLYCGSKKNSGHAFVCDGYDGNGLFHINWGWNGLSNGYFLLNVLNPDVQGTGSASGAYGYIYNQSAVVGLEPGSDTGDYALTSTDVALKTTSASRYSSSSNFKITVSGRFRNLTSEVMAVSFGWGLYQGSTLKSVLYSADSPSLRPGFYYSTMDKVLNCGSGLTSGTYRIVPIYSEYYASNWRPCLGSDKNYIEVTIDGNTCTCRGYGTAGLPDYTVNDITVSGLLHHGRPVDIGLSLTNNGESANELLYMHVNGAFTASGYVGIGKGETAVVPFRFMPSAAGNYTLTFSFNEDGSSPIATRPLTISAMPEAHLTATAAVLDVTDEAGMIVTSNKFSVQYTITNSGSATYREDISVKLYKNIYDETGSNVQAVNQLVELAPGETRMVQFDLDNVIDGWRYFACAFYYSEGNQVQLKRTANYTIVCPAVPQSMIGDVNDDHSVDIDDVTMLIGHILTGASINVLAGDINQDNSIDIDDVTQLIQMILGNRSAQ